jgi:uncharacterized phage protein (TIGR01671 family)
MREIKFRGLRLDGGGWVYGSLLQSEIDVNKIAVKCAIVERFADDYMITKHEVMTETVGQFTSFKDMNGKDIYESDILQSKYIYSGRVWDKARFENEPQIKKDKVLFNDGKFTIGYGLPIRIAGDNYPYSKTDQNHAMTWTETYSDFEIIGNIYDNNSIDL